MRLARRHRVIYWIEGDHQPLPCQRGSSASVDHRSVSSLCSPGRRVSSRYKSAVCTALVDRHSARFLAPTVDCVVATHLNVSRAISGRHSARFVTYTVDKAVAAYPFVSVAASVSHSARFVTTECGLSSRYRSACWYSTAPLVLRARVEVHVLQGRLIHTTAMQD